MRHELRVRLLVRGTIPVFGDSLDSITSKLTRRRRSAKGSDWPSCQVHVESSKLYAKQEAVTVPIGYSYSVSGEYYAGYFEEALYMDASAEGLADSLTEGQEVTIRCNLSKPERSLLLQQDQPQLRLA